MRNAKALAKALLDKGIQLVTGGTDNHLVMIDLTPFNLTGRQAETALRESGITVNRNTVPRDPNGPWYTSGVRLGTAALTTLGMKEEEMREVASLIHSTLSTIQPTTVLKTGLPSKVKYSHDPSVLEKNKSRVHDLLSDYKLYPELNLLLDHKQVLKEST